MIRSLSLLCSLAVLLGAPVPAQSAEPDAGAPSSEGQDPAAQKPTPAEYLAKYDPKPGPASVGAVAEVRLADGWLWLDSANARRFLTDIGNPDDASVLGIAFPPDVVDSDVFAVYSYEDEGHVEDEEPDYDELLASMQEDTRASNEARRKAGYQGVELLGWAEPPHYDAAEHKLYWAKELRFEGEEGSVLNYNVRVLGRTGTVEINGVGAIEQLPLVAAHCKELLRVTGFVEGQRYSDFDPGVDKVAAYGIGGLIAGKVLLKTGLFALLLKNIKLVLLGVVAIGAFLWKLVSGRSRAGATEQVQPAVEE